MAEELVAASPKTTLIYREGDLSTRARRAPEEPAAQIAQFLE